MARKVNPHIYRVGKTETWDIQHFEKKKTEKPLYSLKALEIRNFVVKCFQNYDLNIYKINVDHNDDFVRIEVSYHNNLSVLSYLHSIVKELNIQFSPTHDFYKQDLSYFKQYGKYILNSHKYFCYYRLLYMHKKLAKNDLPKRIYFLNCYVTNRTVRRFRFVSSMRQSSFIKKVSNSLRLFCGKNMKISIKLSQVNNSLNFATSWRESEALQRYINKLRRFEETHFFDEGLNTVFTIFFEPKSSNLLATFIATQLSKNKKHNFFLSFLKTALKFFPGKSYSKIGGLKIQIKGRFNGAPRARQRTILITNGVSVIPLTSKIDYSETTAFTSNGTFGVKVWIQKKPINYNV